MKVRELLVSIVFKTDTASLAQAEQAIASLKSRLAEVEQTAVRTTAVADGVSRIGKASKQAGVDSKAGIDVANEAVEEMFERMNAGGSKLDNIFFALKGRMMQLAAFAGIGFSVQQFIALGDQYKVLTGQIKNVTASEQEALEVREKLFAMSGRTRQGFQQATGLFTSVSRSAKELGKSTDDILLFTEDIANALLVGGGSAESQQAALIQLGQALGSGTLRGDELNSILEQAPVLAKTIADGMGTTIGHLRKMGADGKLTSQALFNAVRSQSDALKKQLENTPWTVQQALGLIRDSMLKLFGTIEEKTNIISYIAQGLAKVADVINVVTKHADLLVMAMKLAAFWAGVFWARNKWGNIVTGYKALVGVLTVLRYGFTNNAIAALAFRDASTAAALANAKAWIKSAAAMAVANAPLIALLTLFTLLALAVEDFYIWIKGGDSILGRTFGKWEDSLLNKRWTQWVTEFKKSTEQVKQFFDWVSGGIVAGINWIIDVLKTLFFEFTPLGIAIKGIRDNWDEVCDAVERAIQKVKTFFGIKEDEGKFRDKVMTDADAISKRMAVNGNTTNVNKSVGSINNNITINAKTNATADDIGNTLAERLATNTMDLDDYSFPATEGG